MTFEPVSGPPRGTLLPAATAMTHDVEGETLLYRVHDRKYHPGAFNATPEHIHFGGTRFGGTALDRYPVLYAATEPESALLETLLHDISFAGGLERTVPRPLVEKYLLSTLKLTKPVKLVSLLDAKALSAVATDSWLIHSERPSYPRTRWWSQWIRENNDWAKGLIWPSKRNVGGKCLVLFGDRFDIECGIAAQVDYSPIAVPVMPPIDFATPAGSAWLRDALKPYGAVVA
jgi:RES domain